MCHMAFGVLDDTALQPASAPSQSRLICVLLSPAELSTHRRTNRRFLNRSFSYMPFCLTTAFFIDIVFLHSRALTSSCSSSRIHKLHQGQCTDSPTSTSPEPDPETLAPAAHRRHIPSMSVPRTEHHFQSQ